MSDFGLDRWSLTNPPPEGHTDVGPYVWKLFMESKAYKERQRLPERWRWCHAMYMGNHWGASPNANYDRHKITLNLVAANINRIVANLTATDPRTEVFCKEGIEDEVADMFTILLDNWWKDSSQKDLLTESGKTMEKYGTTVEKHGWDYNKKQPLTIVCDPFSIFPAPGYFADTNNMPYIIQAEHLYCDEVERTYGIRGVEPDENLSKDVLGLDRIDNLPGSANSLDRVYYEGGYSTDSRTRPRTHHYGNDKALVLECWLRDNSTVKANVLEGYNDRDEPVWKVEDVPKYNGNIRRIVITNNGKIVLSDEDNPNVCGPIAQENASEVSSTYGYDHFPFTFASSFKDNQSIWGLSNVEQFGKLNLLINQLISRMMMYLNKRFTPTMLVPKGEPGLKHYRLTNLPFPVLEITNPHLLQFIRFLVPPPISQDEFAVFSTLVNFFDRLWAIQDVDRGEAPSGVKAASAIIALQERNKVLQSHKIGEIDHLAQERGRWAVSFYQNYGESTKIKIKERSEKIRPCDHRKRKFEYYVEPGSSSHRSKLQIKQEALQLFHMNAIDRRDLLEKLDWPNWKIIIERMSETQIDAALQMLVDAGLPREEAIRLKAIVSMPQGGPGDVPKPPGTQTVAPGPVEPPSNVQLSEQQGMM